MRKAYKTKRKYENVKPMHNATTFKDTYRFRSGYDSFLSARKSALVPNQKTNFSTRRKTSIPTSNYKTEASFSSSIGGSGDPERKTFQNVGEEVIQVVEELMEQTYILKNHLVEMVSHYHEKFCACSEFSSLCAGRQNPTCQSMADISSTLRTRGGLAANNYMVRDSSGYESNGFQESYTTHSSTKLQSYIPPCGGKADCPCGIAVIPTLEMETQSHFRPMLGRHSCTNPCLGHSFRYQENLERETTETYSSKPAGEQDIQNTVNKFYPCPCVTVSHEENSNIGLLSQETTRKRAGSSQEIQMMGEESLHEMSRESQAPTSERRTLPNEESSEKAKNFEEISKQLETVLEELPSRRETILPEDSTPILPREMGNLSLEVSRDRGATSEYVAKEGRSSSRKTFREQRSISQRLSREREGSTNNVTIIEEYETVENIRAKLIKAQEDIKELQEQIKSFVNCSSQKSAGSNIKVLPVKVSSQLIDKVEQINTILNDLKCDCNQRVSICDHIAVPLPGKDTTNEYLVKAPKDLQNRTTSVYESSTANGDKSVRAVSTMKENGMIYSPDGGILKTLNRTEFVEGETTEDGSATNLEIKTSSARNSDSNMQQANVTPRTYHPIDNSQYLQLTQSRTNLANKLRILPSDGMLKRSIPLGRTSIHDRSSRLQGGVDKQQEKVHSLTQKTARKLSAPQTPLQQSSDDSIMVSEDELRAARPLAHRYRRKNLPDDEFVYPKIARKMHQHDSQMPDSNVSQIHCVPANINSQMVSLVGCKFCDQPMSRNECLNLGGRTDSYFIELLPKRSLSSNDLNKNMENNRDRKKFSTTNNSKACESHAVDRYTSSTKGSSVEGSNWLPNSSQLHATARKVLNSYLCNPTDGLADYRFQGGSAPTQPAKGSPEIVIRSIHIDHICNIIKQLSGRRSPKEFFITILPEKQPSRNFRINVIDKDSGNLLGYFYVEERNFHKARAQGVFDKYLSLLVLNSLASYTSFKNGVNPKVLNEVKCFGICASKEHRDDH